MRLASLGPGGGKSEGELDRKLKLPRVKHGSRRSEISIRCWWNRKCHRSMRWLYKSRARSLSDLGLQGGSIAKVLWNGPTEEGRAIHAKHLVHVLPVEHVEGIEGEIEPHMLGHLKSTGNTQIPRTQGLPDV